MASAIAAEVGARLSQVRRRLNLSQAEFADRLGVPMHTYRNYERGTREMPQQMVVTLYSEFRVDPLWLFIGDEGTKKRLARMRETLFDVVEQVDQAVRESATASRSKLPRHVVEVFAEAWESAEAIRDVSSKGAAE